MPSYEEISAGLREILDSFADQGQALNEDTDLVADLGLSSLQILDLLMLVEERFDVTVPLNFLPEVRTVRDFAVQLEKLLSQTP